MPDLADLQRALERIDRSSYGAYKSVRGTWRGDGLSLSIDHVQGDPFAAPSRVRLTLPASWHGLPSDLYDEPVRRVALADFLLARFADQAERLEAPGSGGSGRVRVDAGGPAVLARSGCLFDGDTLELRFRVGLPAQGRRVLGRAASKLLTVDLPKAVECLRWVELPEDRVRTHVQVVEDHQHLQRKLSGSGLVAFVRDGSVLPRASGVSGHPMENAVPFESPPTLRITMETKHHGEVVGMGVPEGVTLLVGGGFHGKTTLLSAIASGVYPHVPGDGREWVVTREDAVWVRSEDGRCVTSVDLSPFIGALPGGRETTRFESEDASGSTSLAASIVESIELNSDTLLFDEDTCATNLLVRDARMQVLVDAEPILPLIDRVRALYRDHGVSSVLALGGSGDYLEVADTVVGMRGYRPEDLGVRAREVVELLPSARRGADRLPPIRLADRRPLAASFPVGRRGRPKVRAHNMRELSLGDTSVDLVGIMQLVDESQVRAIGALLARAAPLAEGLSVPELIDALMGMIELSLLGAEDSPELARPRRHELGAALNRLRGLRMA